MDLVNRTKVLSRRTGTYVMISFFMIMIFLYASGVFAGPEGAQVINGQVSFQQSGLNTTITASNKAIINYTKFDIARPEIVEFIQPSSTASVLNRILSANPTAIDGTLLANGRVFFLNPAGVIIGEGARINVNQLVASALNMSNSDFINGRYNFAGGNGPVINRGDIVAEKVYLIAKQVVNSGAISCPAGYVVMAVGDRVFLGEVGSDVMVEIDVPSVPAQPLEGAAVLNEGTVDVGSGTIVLAAAGDIYAQAISNVGTLSASTQTGNAGQVKLAAADGVIANTGSIEAKSASAAGGVVSAEGKTIVNLGTIDVTGAEGGQVAINAASRLGQFGTIKADGTSADGGDIDLWAGELDVVGNGSVTTANAGLNGNGGEIRVLADMDAGFAGLGPEASLQAKGGTQSGDGGLVELSARNFQTLTTDIDVSAQNGESGTFLLDPTDIVIRKSAAGSEDYDGGTTFPDYGGGGLAFAQANYNFDGGLSNEVASGYIHSLLDTGAGTNVILQAQQDIIIDDLSGAPFAGALKWTTTADLILQAGRNITIGPFASSDFIGTNGGGDIHIEAYSTHSPSQTLPGRITIGSNVELRTRGTNAPGNIPGDVTLIGLDFVLDGTIDTVDTAYATAGTVKIGPAYDGMNMTLGSGGAMLNNTELGNITTYLLKVGRATTAGSDGAGTNYRTFTAGNIGVDNVVGGGNFTDLWLVGNSIDDADTTFPVVTSNLTVNNLILETIGSSIGGTTNPLDIDVTNVDVEKGGSGAADVFLYDCSAGLTITDLSGDGYGADLQGGNLTVIAASPITVSSEIEAPGNITLIASDTGVGDHLRIDADITSTGGNIYLYAGDDILLSDAGVSYYIESQKHGGGGGIVTLISAYGDSGDGGSILGEEVGIIADNITLSVGGTGSTAPGTIGVSGTPIQIDLGTGTLTFETGDPISSGHVYIEENNFGSVLTRGNIYSSQINGSTDATTSQTIYFENNYGFIDFDKPISPTQINDNLIIMTTGGSAGDITFSRYSSRYQSTSPDAILIDTTGNVTLDASGAIRDGLSNTAIDVQSTGAGTVVTLNAGDDGIGTPFPGPTDDRAVEVYATYRFDADTGLGVNGDNSDIYINSIGDLPIGRINAADAGVPSPRGDVYLTSTGNMTDARPGPGPNLLGDKAELTASTGIGDDSIANGDLNVHLNELEATTVTGDIYVTDTLGGLIVGDTLPTVGATITAGSSATDNITITASSPLTINGLVSGPGNITLTADNSSSTTVADNLTLNADVTSTGGALTAITLNAGDSILQTNGTVSTAGGAIIATANTELDDGTGWDDFYTAEFAQSSGTSFVSNGGPITVLAWDNATLRLLDAGTGMTAVVAVKSANGSIIDNRWRARPNIIGYAAFLDAFTGVGSSGYGDINTDVDCLAADTQTGGIYVTNDGALTIALIYVPVFGTLTGVQVTGSGNIEITATSPMYVDAPVSGPADITLTAGNNSGVPGDDLVIQNPVTSTGGAGTAINLNAGDSIDQTMGNVSTQGGTIIATADTEGDGSGGFTQHDYPTAFLSNGGNIFVLSYDDAMLTLLDAGPAGAVCVFSSAGAIKDNTAAETSSNIIAGFVTLLDAFTGIGSTGADDIDTTTPYLAADTQTGGIYITNTGALTIGGIVSSYGTVLGAKITAGGAPADDIVIIATSPLTVVSPVEGPGDITLTAGNSGALGDDLTLSENVTSRGAGTITLNAGDNISQTDSYIVQTSGGQIIATADTEGNGSGGFQQNDGASFVSGGGPIMVSAYGNADLSKLDAGTTGAVQVTSTNYGINDNTAAETPANIIGATAELKASTGIGGIGDADIDTTIANLEAATVTGDIYITDTAGGLTIGSIVPPGLGLVGVQITTPGANTDDIVIVANSPLTVNELVQGPGNITLTAAGIIGSAGDNLALNANVISTGTGTTIDLNAGDGISQAATSVVQITGVGTIDADADTEADGIDTDPAGFTQADGASFVVLGAGSNIISVRSRGDAKLSSLNAGPGAVDVYSTNGAITDNTSTILGEAANITGATAELKAATGIGGSAANADIDTTIANLEAATVTGGIYVTDTAGGLIIGGISPGVLGLVGAQVTGASGDIVIIANSPLTVNELVYGPANITLTAGDDTGSSPGDDLTLSADVTSTGSGKTIALNAGDSILQNSGTVSNGIAGTIIATANTEGDAGNLTPGVDDGDPAEFTQADTGTSFVSNGGQIYVLCYGDAKLSLLNEGSTTVVGVFSSAGAIMDNTGAENANIISYAALLDAFTGIGSTGVGNIDTTTSLLAADTQTGGIYVTDTAGGLIITTVMAGDYGTLSGAQITAGAGDIVIVATSPLTVNELVEGPANITLTASGTTSPTVADDLTLNANVTSRGPGNINLYAGDSIYQNYPSVVQTSGGAIVATANNEGDAGGGSDDGWSSEFYQAHRTSFVSGGGPITVSSYGNATICLLDAAGKTGLVSVTSAAFSILDNRWGPRPNIVGNSAVLDAFTGVGSSSGYGYLGHADINTDIDKLEADTQTGGIYVTNDGALTIGNIGLMVGAKVTVAGDIVIAATSPLTVDELVSGPANITLTAGGTSSSTVADDLTINANVTSTGGAGTTIALNAGDSIIQNTGTTVSTLGGAIVATADTEWDYGYDGYPAGFTQNGTASFVSGGGDISVYSYGNAAITLLNAGTGSVTVTTTNGAITDNRSSSAYNIIGYSADLNAYAGIGNTGYGDIDTAVTWISADTTDGDVGIENTNGSDVTATSLTTGTGNIVFSQSGGGDLWVYNASTINGDIDITVAGADLIALYVEAGIYGGTDDGDVTLTTTSSEDDDVWVDDVRAINDMITINSNGAIMEYGDDPAIDLTAAELYLYAMLGIYGSSPIETSATTVWGINWGNGDIDIQNTLASDASVFTWIFGTGDTKFVQNGGGNLSLIGAITYDGTIWVQVDDGGNLLAQGPCHIDAGGTYYLNDPLHDSRPIINFLDAPLDGRDPGDPFDLAVYLASTGGNVIVDMPVTIAANGALVIDAYDTVTFGGTFEDNANVDWLEVCSRITETLNEAAAWGTLPYVDEFGSGRNPPWFDGEYVLRGGLPDAWVLHWVNIFPWPPVITFEPGRMIAPPVRNFEPEKEGAPYMPAEAESCLDDAYLCSTDVLKP